MCALLQEVLSLQMMLAISPSFVGGGFLLALPPVKELLPGDNSWRRENCSFETRVFLAPVDDPVPVRICTIVMGLSGFSIKVGHEIVRGTRWEGGVDEGKQRVLVVIFHAYCLHVVLNYRKIYLKDKSILRQPQMHNYWKKKRNK